MPVKKTISQYVNEINDLYNQTLEYPDSETIQKKLKNRVGSWADLLEITVFVASNEQRPYTSEELGYSTRSMLLKQHTKIKQVGDLHAYYSGGAVAGWIGVLVERKGGKKGMEDLYGTLMNADNCARFYREIETFQADERFSLMVVIAECTLTDFLRYVPAFSGNKRNYGHVGASVESRRAKINSLYIRGIPVLFAGTRTVAIEMYQGLIRQWILQHFKFILGLETRNVDIERPLSILEV